MDLSFVIPAYNEEGYLKQCLETLIDEIKTNAGGLSTEIIVVDNASTDNTRAVAEQFKDVRVVFESKKSSSFARQKGFAESRGDIIAFLDADTRVPKNWIRTMLDSFETGTNTVAVSGPYIYYDLPPFWKNFAWPYEVILGHIAHLATGHCVAGGNLAIKRSALRSIGGFDTSVVFYGDDLDVARRLQKVGKIIFTDKLYVEASARRFHAQGVLATTGIYAMNFISVAFLKRPINKEFLDVR